MGTPLSPPTLVPPTDFFVIYHRLSGTYGRDNKHPTWKAWNRVGHLKTHLLGQIKHSYKDIWYDKYFDFPISEWEIWNHKNGQWIFISWLDVYIEEHMKLKWKKQYAKKEAEIQAYYKRIGYTPNS